MGFCLVSGESMTLAGQRRSGWQGAPALSSVASAASAASVAVVGRQAHKTSLWLRRQAPLAQQLGLDGAALLPSGPSSTHFQRFASCSASQTKPEGSTDLIVRACLVLL